MNSSICIQQLQEMCFAFRVIVTVHFLIFCSLPPYVLFPYNAYTPPYNTHPHTHMALKFGFAQKKVEPWKLYTMVSALLSVDLVILLTWQLSDPLQRRLETFPLEKPLLSTDDIRISPELEHCESENQSIWLGMCIWRRLINQFQSLH